VLPSSVVVVVQLGLVDILLGTVQVVRIVEVELSDRIVEVAGHKLVVGHKLMVAHKLVELELVDHQ
jgi:hypothetical protein